MYDISGAIEHSRIFMDNEKVGDDITFSLPELPFMTADYRSGGTINLPLLYRLESMECTISKNGIDPAAAKLMGAGTHHFDFRWAQTVLDDESNLKAIGCKAFIHGVSKKAPSFSVDPGSVSSGEYIYEVLDYQLFIDGKEAIFIDKRNGIIRLGGVDQTKEIRSLLD